MKNPKPKGQAKGEPPKAIMGTGPSKGLGGPLKKMGQADGPPLPEVHRGETNLALFNPKKAAKPSNG